MVGNVNDGNEALQLSNVSLLSWFKTLVLFIRSLKSVQAVKLPLEQSHNEQECADRWLIKTFSCP